MGRVQRGKAWRFSFDFPAIVFKLAAKGESVKPFLSANVPPSAVHFVLFVLFGGFLGWSGTVVAKSPGATDGNALWWIAILLDSLVRGAVVTVFAFPLLRKFPK